MNHKNLNKYIVQPLCLGLLLSVSHGVHAASNTVTACDTLAGHPFDINKVTAGVNSSKIDVKLAEPACKEAVTNDPNNPRLQYEYGRVLWVKQDYVGAFTWFSKAADQNYATAQNAVGDAYYFGEGVEKDFAKAFEWTLKAANQTYVVAQYNIGISYYYGEGVAKDYAKAFGWFLKAANQNYADAQNYLGIMYAGGLSVTKDLVKAFEWYQKAVNGLGDNSYGLLNLGAAYHNGEGTAKNEAKALAQWRKASEQGLIDASVELVFSWAEANLPAGLLPGFAESLPPILPKPYDIYAYRHYTANGSNIYVAYNYNDGHIYYLGPATGSQVFDAGSIEPFLQKALAYEKTINP